ncbi:Fe-S cluster biogenesis protein NfuA, 4Fe-4S-binding domain [Lutibacter agarilyticus]|uniref:Fe-S cluster biogenesis protein NfuA, 4Fe-4S-binding domain n=1 Tax=Lutibacter agarilyticus TaxID=1109740 RepID=A0A238WNI7_9FLAO|nr:NifU family protein [Lutibacter agarilyticus]SNR47988.1 Fe-S cluster biogenesis protein NfuA, 4Fe-4S-binding domain [Lutibacter agarilyticus]
MDRISLKIETTRTDTILKFTANNVLTSGSHQYNNIDEAKNSPLAQQLFHLPFVKRVLFSANFIALERFSIVEWNDVQEEVKEQLENYLNSGDPIVIEDHIQKKVPVEVYAEVTPNPSVLKFVANKKLVDVDFEFKSVDEAKDAPLAIELYNFPFVKEIFISENYVSITKSDIVEWGDITVEIRSFIKEFIANGKTIAVASENNIQPTNETYNPEDLDEVSQQIISILDEYIKPAVAADGGNILFNSYNVETKIVNVVLQGACSGCPSSTVTLKNGIENMLKQLIPGKIEGVVAVNY